MAIYHTGIKINNLYHNGVKVQSLYHNGIKIYSSLLPIGTILWSGSKAFIKTNQFNGNDDFFNNNFLVNKEITLTNPISKCKNGIVVNFSKVASISAQSSYFINIPSEHIHLPKSFSNGKIYETSTDMYPALETISLIKSNDSTVYFQSTAEGNISTFLRYRFSNYMDTYLCIDSITAY